MSQISFCTGDGCFEKRYVYKASDEQIDALKVISESCYQGTNYQGYKYEVNSFIEELTYGCKMAPLKNLKFGHHYGWGTGKDGIS